MTIRTDNRKTLNRQMRDLQANAALSISGRIFQAEWVFVTKPTITRMDYGMSLMKDVLEELRWAAEAKRNDSPPPTSQQDAVALEQANNLANIACRDTLG